MTTFRDIPVNDLFAFPRPAIGYAGADLGVCVKLSARRYQAMGRPLVYTVGTTKVEVIAKGENKAIHWANGAQS